MSASWLSKEVGGKEGRKEGNRDRRLNLECGQISSSVLYNRDYEISWNPRGRVGRAEAFCTRINRRLSLANLSNG